jgi:hypothetical protein
MRPVAVERRRAATERSQAERLACRDTPPPSYSQEFSREFALTSVVVQWPSQD